jgi:TrmH family RNA methyltransferase
MADLILSSPQNPRIKTLLQLEQKSSERRRTGLFVVEGQRELRHCLDSGLAVESLFWCRELVPDDFETSMLADVEKVADATGMACSSFEVSRVVYEKIAYRGSTEGVVAVVRERRLTLDDLPRKEHPLIVVLERVEKPGNLGAILRSADAAKADAVVVCDPLTDLYNPNLIRSSIGAIFTVPCVACTTEECIAYLKSNGIRILTAQLQDSHLYYNTDMTCGTAIVMGTESTGLTDTWRRAADAHIRIPMLGQLDSLNVSVSTAILLFEAVRQRLAKE